MAVFFKTFAPPGVVVDAADRFARRPEAVPAALTWVWRRDDKGALVGHWHAGKAAPAAQPCALCAEAA